MKRSLRWLPAGMLLVLSMLSCSRATVPAAEPVAANRFFMLVIEIRALEGGALSFTPIYEDWKEGRLKPFGAGPESGTSGFWRVDHVDREGAVLTSEWIPDPMRGIYEYSEDGQEIESVEFALQESAIALRVPGRVNGQDREIHHLTIYRVHPGDREDEPLYVYVLPNVRS